MNIGRSANLIRAGFAWRTFGSSGAGVTLLNAVAGDDEQERMLAGMALVKAGERSLDLYRLDVRLRQCDAANGPTGCRYRWTTCTPDAHRDGRFSRAARGPGSWIPWTSSTGSTAWTSRTHRQSVRVVLELLPLSPGKNVGRQWRRHTATCASLEVILMSPVACPNCQRESPRTWLRVPCLWPDNAE